MTTESPTLLIPTVGGMAEATPEGIDVTTLLQPIIQLTTAVVAPVFPQATTPAPLSDVTDVYKMETTTISIVGASTNDGSFEAVLGGVITAIILMLLCLTALVLRYMFKHKGTYLTHEEDDGESIEKADIELQRDTALLEAVEEEE